MVIRETIYSQLERRSQATAYPYLLALFLVVCSVFFSWPCFTCFDANSLAWQVMDLKAHDLTHSLEHLDPYTWLAKKVFRLTVPVIMRLTHLPPIAVIALQYLLGYGLLLYSYKLAMRILKDPVMATFLTAGIVFLYFGRAAFFDISTTWFDGVAFFSLVMAMYCRRLLPILLFSLAAAWTDERAFIALGIVFLYHQLDGKDDELVSIKSLVWLNARSITVLASIVAYVGIRFALSKLYGMHTPSVGANLDLMKRTLPVMPAGLFTFLEGFWIVYALAFVQGVRSKDAWRVIVYFLVLAVFTLVAACVTDITRSGTFMVPILFVLLRYLGAVMPKKDLRRALFLGFLLTFAFPAMIVCADWSVNNWFQWPFFVRASKFLF